MTKRISDVDSQIDLVSTLESLRMAAIYDLFGQVLLHDFYKQIAAGKADGSEVATKLPEGTISLKEFSDRLIELGPQALVETKRNANRALTRNLLKETFRITESYCRASGQMDELKVQNWFGFARIVTNSLSHNFRLEFRKHDLGQLPVSYQGVTIDASLDGTALSLKLEQGISLVDETIAFARTLK